jgi:hypothetical protein
MYKGAEQSIYKLCRYIDHHQSVRALPLSPFSPRVDTRVELGSPRPLPSDMFPASHDI